MQMHIDFPIWIDLLSGITKNLTNEGKLEKKCLEDKWILNSSFPTHFLLKIPHFPTLTVSKK